MGDLDLCDVTVRVPARDAGKVETVAAILRGRSRIRGSRSDEAQALLQAACAIDHVVDVLNGDSVDGDTRREATLWLRSFLGRMSAHQKMQMKSLMAG